MNDAFLSLAPLIFIFIIMWFLVIRPQKRAQAQHREMLSAIRRGDTVVMSGGLVGKVIKVISDNELELEISEGVKVRVVREYVVNVRTKGEPVTV